MEIFVGDAFTIAFEQAVEKLVTSIGRAVIAIKICFEAVFKTPSVIRFVMHVTITGTSVDYTVILAFLATEPLQKFLLFGLLILLFTTIISFPKA